MNKNIFVVSQFLALATSFYHVMVVDYSYLILFVGFLLFFFLGLQSIIARMVWRSILQAEERGHGDINDAALMWLYFSITFGLVLLNIIMIYTM